MSFIRQLEGLIQCFRARLIRALDGYQFFVQYMSQAAKSLFVFGIYLCGLGLILLFVPNLLLQVFGVPQTNEVWIRINGMFVLCLSFYYVQVARNELTIFMRWTVWTRIAVMVYFAAFVLWASAPKALLLFGLIDLSAAIWTWLALKKDGPR